MYNFSMNIKDLAKKYTTLVIIGMCKNAGKTTALNLLLSQKNLAITSVGLDGETIDAVTGTQKPRIFVKKDTLVATTTSLLNNCTVSKEILMTTGISSPIGEIVIFKAIDDGFVEIAGPSITADLVKLKKIFFNLGAKRIIIDGALSRKSISSPKIADGAILATGASYNKDINKVVADTAHIIKLYNLPTISFPPIESCDLLKTIQEGNCKVFVSGALTETELKSICVKKAVSSITIGVEDASKILASKDTLSLFFARGGKIEVKNKVKIFAVTINPYSPYGWEFDKNILKVEMSKYIDLPIINAMEENNEF